jgi:hypothetical protein
VEQAKRTHAVKATGQDVLQDATQELVSGEAHGLALVIAAVLVAEGHGTIVEVVDRTVGDRGLVDVATEVVEDLLRALHRGFGEDDPAFAPGDLGNADARQSTSREVKEAPSKELGERAHRDEVPSTTTRRGEPRAPVRCEAAPGDEHVDMRMPFEGPCPGVEDGERANLGAEVAQIGAQARERLEGGPEEHGQELPLVRAHEAAELRGEREDDVEVGHRQDQVSLAIEGCEYDFG